MVPRASILVCTLLAATAGARASETAPVECGEGVLLRVSSPSPEQGSILVVEVRSDAPIASVAAMTAGVPLHFWSDNEGRVHQALVGVDFLTEPGPRPLEARVALASGASVRCALELRIVDGAFPVQRLRVEPKYVELSPENLARSRRESAELDAIFTSVTRERLWRTGFVPPVPGYSASGSFGKRRVFNDQPRNPHSGEDFPAPAGTPVRAGARGRVALAKGLFFLGNTVVIDHGLGLISYFGHLSSIDVEPGAIVEADTVVGKVGATGRVTGAHLHWGVRLADARVNPLDLLELGR